MTPPELARRVVEHFPLSGVCLDPCRGTGAFFENFPASVDARWCELSEGRDFFQFSTKVDWIVSNPPWSKYRAFTAHAMTLADNVVWLVPVTNAIGLQSRLRDIYNAGFYVKEILLLPYARAFPSSGFQLAAVHISKHTPGTPRMTLWTGGVEDMRNETKAEAAEAQKRTQ